MIKYIDMLRYRGGHVWHGNKIGNNMHIMYAFMA